jgi:hypothetical protein
MHCRGPGRGFDRGPLGKIRFRSSRTHALPACIEGAFEALPRGRDMPKRRQITVTFGGPEPIGILRAAGTGRTDEEQIGATSRERVAALAAASGAVAGAELSEPTGIRY